jgi:hypothetical protein
VRNNLDLPTTPPSSQKSRTHKGEILGIPPTNKSFNVRPIDIIEIRDSKMTAHWGMTDHNTDKAPSAQCRKIEQSASTAFERNASTADPTNEDRMERDRLRRRILATTILIGAAIGLVVGILTDYIGLAVAVGVAVGLAVGEGIYQRR